MDTPTRLLRLLSLLHARPEWPGLELAERVGVTTRTLRRDVTRLRSLGYRIDAVTGKYGGYRLGAGRGLPPLLLDDDEAVSVAVGLRAVTGGTDSGLEESAMAALLKLEQVLPSRLRGRMTALHAVTVQLTGGVAAGVDPGALVTLAQASKLLERLRFSYVDGAGRRSARLVEPYRLVHTGRRWYLVARDVDRDAWRTFRVDRIETPRATGSRFSRSEEPDAAALVARGIASAPYPIRARVALRVSRQEVARLVPPTIGIVQPAADGGTVLTIGGETDWLVGYLCGLPCAFEVLEPVELRAAVRARGERLARSHV
ncbi:MAG: helix-turn-helix transcriptional regulator [Streptosporangiaceae bacterium]